MPTAEELARFNSRNVAGDPVPIETFLMAPLPPKVLKAFPELEEWHKVENERRAEFIKRLNTREGGT